MSFPATFACSTALADVAGVVERVLVEDECSAPAGAFEIGFSDGQRIYCHAHHVCVHGRVVL